MTPGEYLVFGFFCTFDYSFDDADGATIALIPDMTKSSDLTTYRRIDVLPNTNGVGAGSGGPAENTPPGVFFGADYGIRYERTIPNLAMWKGNAGGTWDVPAAGDFNVNNFLAQAASWRPSTAQTTSVGAQTIPSSHTTHSHSTSRARRSSRASGEVTVAMGGGGQATVAEYGRRRQLPDRLHVRDRQRRQRPGRESGHAARRRLELRAVGADNSAQGGTAWNSLQGHFGLYLNLFRFSRLGAAGTGSDGARRRPIPVPAPEPDRPRSALSPGHPRPTTAHRSELVRDRGDPGPDRGGQRCPRRRLPEPATRSRMSVSVIRSSDRAS